MADDMSIRVEGLWKHYGLSAHAGIGQLVRAVITQGGSQPGDEDRKGGV